MKQTPAPARPQLTESDSIFDGFMHRNFNPEIDGWRNEMPDDKDYPSVRNALDTIAMFEELRAAKRRIWDLEKKLEDRKNWRILAGSNPND